MRGGGAARGGGLGRRHPPGGPDQAHRFQAVCGARGAGAPGCDLPHACTSVPEFQHLFVKHTMTALHACRMLIPVPSCIERALSGLLSRAGGVTYPMTQLCRLGALIVYDECAALE